MLPEWVSQPAAVCATRPRRASRAVSAFLRESARFVAQTLFLERLARRQGWLQALDARAKLLAVLGLLVAASFLHHLLSLWLLALVALVMLFASHIGPRTLLHRSWWLAPALFALAALPALLSIITPGRPLLILWRAPELALTYPGLVAVARFLSRLLVGVLLALLLTLTTRAEELFKAAYTSLTAPFVYVLTIMHRHLFLLLQSAEELHLARRARTLRAPSPQEQRRWLGAGLAFLFRRSQHQTEEVYLAMQARGYTGQPRALRESRTGVRELLWLGLCAVAAACALVLDLVLLRSWSW